MGVLATEVVVLYDYNSAQVSVEKQQKYFLPSKTPILFRNCRLYFMAFPMGKTRFAWTSLCCQRWWNCQIQIHKNICVARLINTKKHSRNIHLCDKNQIWKKQQHMNKTKSGYNKTNLEF